MMIMIIVVGIVGAIWALLLGLAVATENEEIKRVKKGGKWGPCL